MNPILNQYEFGPFRLDPAERRLLREGETVSLSPKVFDLLLVLVRRNGAILEKEELLSAVWPDTIVEENNLSVNISALRKALGEGPNEHTYIETLPRRGYRFVAPVRELNDQDREAPGQDRAPDVRASVSVKPSLRLLKPGVLLASLAVATALIAGFAYAWRKMADGDASEAAPLGRVIPFSSFQGRESSPAFSPDGNQIAFIWSGEQDDNLDIYVKLIDGGDPLRLTTDAADDLNPVWSPDGRYVAFYRQAAEGGSIFIAPALGGGERKLIAATRSRSGGGALARWLSWSPDGEYLAASEQDSPSGPYGIILIARETGLTRRVTSPSAPVVGDFCPAFAPDGKTLAFVRVNSPEVEDLYVMPSDGGDPLRLTFDHSQIGAPAWTPDGREIVYTTRLHGMQGLWRIPATGGRPKYLLESGQGVCCPSFARQGGRMAYVQYANDTNVWRLDLTAARSANKQAASMKRLIASTLYEGAPQYSPDGKRIAFVSTRLGNQEVWVCDSEGERPMQLTDFRGARAGTPRWSPDGRQIVFDCSPDGNADIFVIDSEGGRPRRLTSESSEDVLPSWSRDGRWVYFSSTRDGQTQIWKASAAGGAAEQVTRQGGHDALESPDGRWLYYAKGRGLPAVWRMPVTGGAETLVYQFSQPGGRLWTVMNEGLYFAGAAPSDRPTINFFNFSTGRVTPVMALEKGLSLGGPGLSVSPDGRWLLFSQVDRRGSDIMLLENFR
jgi:Tol biopolymer transport system component/DNA-binding winged helix-turn-helix (wHTH) protein